MQFVIQTSLIISLYLTCIISPIRISLICSLSRRSIRYSVVIASNIAIIRNLAKYVYLCNPRTETSNI